MRVRPVCDLVNFHTVPSHVLKFDWLSIRAVYIVLDP